MPVGDQDRRAAGAHLRELEPQARRVVSRVDDRRFGGAPLGAHDVAVGADRPELVTVDGEAHGLVSLTATVSSPTTPRGPA